METLEQIRELFVYNDWANRRIIESLRKYDCPPALEILAHVLITEKEYYERLFGKDSTGFDFWQKISVEECVRLALENAERYRILLEKFDEEGLGQIALYRTSEGTDVKNTFREIFMHVLFHSMNHRGQITKALRRENFAPPAGLDYIIFCREMRRGKE